MMEVLKTSLPTLNCILKMIRLLLFLQFPFSVAGIGCSPTTITNFANKSGVIQSPGFPESYPQGSSYSCIYQLMIIGDGYITISFADFHLHNEPVFTCKNNGTYDYLTINLHNNQSPIYYCSVGRPPTIIAPKEKVTIELVVHAPPSPGSFRGFQMHYSFITEEKKAELSSNFHLEQTSVPTYVNDEGRFSVPTISPPPHGFTSQSLDIIWYVTAPTVDDRIQLTVTDIYPPYVPAPMLLITDGPTSKSTALQHGVHVDSSPFISSQRFMFVQLKGTVGAGTVFEVEFSFFREPNHFGSCPDGFVQCRKSSQCIKNHLLCNERGNCRQGEDEDRCYSPCDPNPCLNGGTCIVSRSNPDMFRCICSRSFTGHICANRHSLTTVAPACRGICLNGGMCVDGECRCPTDFFGTRCEFSASGETNPDLEHTSIMIGAFVGAVCLLSICWLVAMARKRYTEAEEQQQAGSGRPPQRMISVHSPEELGLRRSTTNGPGDLEIPPEYSDVFVEENKPIPATRPSIISASEPLSPPPSYDIVTGQEDLGIVIEFPVAENTNLPDVVSQNESDNSSVTHSSPPGDTVDDSENVSRQTSRSTEV